MIYSPHEEVYPRLTDHIREVFQDIIVSRVDSSSCPEALSCIGEILNSQVLVTSRKVLSSESTKGVTSLVGILHLLYSNGSGGAK